jgi:N-acetylglucosaminyldiphosphoundecaprenol N-acetyl-beta-D-mannosaminyltransferase
MISPNDLRDKTIILGVKIDDLTLETVLNRIAGFLESETQHTVFTPNPEICLKAEADETYRKILNEADINTPDGIGLKLGAMILGEKIENRVTGVDLTASVLKLLNEKKKRAFVLLRKDSLTKSDELKRYFKNSFPQIDFDCGVVDIKDYLNCNEVLDQINEFSPDVLFSSLGAPFQELWISRYLKILSGVKVALGVGGTFDFLTEKMQRAPEVVRQLGFEWLYRLYREPKRLKRIKSAVADFLLACHKWRDRIKTEMRENVVGVIKNKDGKYLLALNPRFNHWQFPQGGVEAGESPEAAVVREVSEEVGSDPRLFEVEKEIPEKHEYVSPRYAQLLKGYKGQSQTAFVLKFSGSDKDFDFSETDEAEKIVWLDKNELVGKISPMRRDFAKRIVKHLE